MRTQHSMKNLVGHSVVLDVLATDSQGILYNIEIQRSDTGALPKRARYLSSIIDTNIFQPTENYEALPQTYVIFITENDVLHENRLIYHIDRIITESGRRFDDGAHIIYVNASFKDDSALGILMHDFKCSDPYQMNYSERKEKTIVFKEAAKEVTKMCEIWEEVRREGIAEGIEIARDEFEKARAEAEAEAKAEAKERATKTALRMIKQGNLTVEEIAEYTGLTEDEVREYMELIAG